MALAALIVSAVAVLVTIWGAVYAKRSAAYARRMSDNDDARRHFERTPQLVHGIKSVNSGGWHQLSLVLRSAEPLTGLTAEILDGRGVHFPSNQNGVPPGGAPSDSADWPDPLATGERAVWRLEIPADGKAHRFRLRVTCRRADGEWIVLLDVETRRRPFPAGAR